MSGKQKVGDNSYVEIRYPEWTMQVHLPRTDGFVRLTLDEACDLLELLQEALLSE